MEVIQTVKFQKEGNDCLIQVIISLTKVFDCYTVYQHIKYIGGWCDSKICQENYQFDNKKSALRAYNTALKEMKGWEKIT